MTNSEKFNQAFNYFKKPYSYKMGGTQTVILPNGKSHYFNDREFYSVAKYNNNIKHDIIGDVKVSRKEYSKFLQTLKEREQKRVIALREYSEKLARIERAKAKGIYSILQEEHGDYIELSDEEQTNKYYDAARLAKTLDIKIEDAKLLSSIGKTYVFAKRISSGVTIQLYHPSLDCNNLSISFSVVSKERVAEFKHDEWYNAPYAYLVGQTESKNHFVC